MTVSEIIQRIQSLFHSGVENNNNPITNRHIYSKMLTVRSRLLIQHLQKKQTLSDWNYQTLPAVEIVEVPLQECLSIPSLGCTVRRSKYEIPKPLSDYNKDYIDYVMSIDFQKRFVRTTRQELRYAHVQKYTRNMDRYLIHNNYLFLYGNIIPKVVMIRMLAEDPYKILAFKGLCKEEGDCLSPLDMEFPIDNYFIDALIQLCLQELGMMGNPGKALQQPREQEQQQQQQNQQQQE